MILKKTTAFIIFILFGNGVIFGQEISADSVRKLVAIYKPLLETDTIDLAQRKVFKVSENLYRVDDRFPAGSLAAEKYSKTIPLQKVFPEINIGTEFFKNGVVRRIVSRSEDNTRHIIKEYFNSGNLYKEYVVDFPGGTTVLNVFDINGNQLVKDGDGQSSEVTMSNSESYTEYGLYEKGRKKGKWNGIYENGQVYYVEIYNDNGLVSGKSFDTDRREFGYTVEEEMPMFQGGEKMLFKHLSRNTNYPKDASKKNISGIIPVRFVVEKDGSVSDVVHLKDGFPSLVEEAKRVVTSMSGKWIPGKKRGIPVKLFFIIPIIFSISG